MPSCRRGAKALSPADVADAAAYYASVDAPFLPLKAPDPALVTRGETLATVGSAERRTQSCDNCHGPMSADHREGAGNKELPASMNIAFTLRQWQRGFRQSSPNEMAVVAKKLDEQEIAAVAAYYQQVRPRLETAQAQQKD